MKIYDIETHLNCQCCDRREKPSYHSFLRLPIKLVLFKKRHFFTQKIKWIKKRQKSVIILTVIDKKELVFTESVFKEKHLPLLTFSRL